MSRIVPSGDWVNVAGQSLPVKRAIANLSASTTAGSVVAAVAGRKIRVIALFVLAGSTATDITFLSQSTAISPLMSNAANGGEVLPPNPYGWFETAAGEPLRATTGSGSATGILVLYIEVP